MLVFIIHYFWNVHDFGINKCINFSVIGFIGLYAALKILIISTRLTEFTRVVFVVEFWEFSSTRMAAVEWNLKMGVTAWFGSVLGMKSSWLHPPFPFHSMFWRFVHIFSVYIYTLYDREFYVCLKMHQKCKFENIHLFSLHVFILLFVFHKVFSSYHNENRNCFRFIIK